MARIGQRQWRSRPSYITPKDMLGRQSESMPERNRKFEGDEKTAQLRPSSGVKMITSGLPTIHPQVPRTPFRANFRVAQDPGQTIV